MLSFSSYGWLTVMAILDSSEDRNAIVGYPDAYRFDPYCRTALGVQRDLVKAYQRCIIAYTAILQRAGIDGHAQLFYCTVLVNP